MKDLNQPSRKTIHINLALEQGCALPGVFFAERPHNGLSDRAMPVRVPQNGDARAEFLRAWARKNSRRIAQGLGVLALVMPMATAASAQEGPIAVETIAGVVDAVLEDNGDLLLTLADGSQLRINQQGVEIGDDGTIFLIGSAAEAVMIAAAEVSGTESDGSMIALAAGAGGLLLAAAAGGGGSDDGAAPQPVELGFAVDGYLSGATVYGDANGNLVLDVGEIQTVTDADGSFNTALFPDDVPLVTIGGIDISTGETFTGTLRAPAGSTNITPLTTLVQALVENSAGSETPLSVADATASVASSLGLTGDAAELLTVDPAALAESGDASQLQAAAKVAAVINLVTAASPDDPTAVDTVLTALTIDLTDGGDDPFGSVDAITAALATAGDAIQVNTSDLANAIVEVSTAIDGITGDSTDALAALEQIQTAVQGDLTDAVTNSVGDTGTESPLATTDVTSTIDQTVGLRPVITTFTPTTDPVAEGAAITISGTGRVGSTVFVEIGEAIEAAPVGLDGTWSAVFTSATYLEAGVSAGTVSAVVTAVDAAVTSGAALGAPSYVIDNDPPAAPTIDPVTGDNLVATADVSNDTYTVTGTAEEGSTVIINVDGVEGEAVLNGTNWSYQVSVTPGTEAASDTIFAYATDAVGNQSADSAIVQVSIDLGAPAAPTIDPVSVDNRVGIADAPNDTYTITGSAEDGSTVFVSVNGVEGQATMTGTSWSYEIAATPGTEFEQDTVFAYAADAAGNQSPNSGTVVVTVDLTTPPQPSFDALNGTIDGSAIGSVVISGSAEPNTTVILESTLFGAPIEVPVGGDSNWNTGPLDLNGAADAVYTITATSVDQAGNTSPSATAERVVDVVPDTLPVITLIDDETGQPYPADYVSVYDSVELEVINANGSNEFSFGTITNVPVGTVMTLTVTDAGGTLLRGPYTAETLDNAGNFQITVPDADIVSLNPMTSVATVTVSGGGATAQFGAIVNSGITGDPSTGFVFVGQSIVDPATDFEAFGTAGETTRTILDGAQMDNGDTVVVAEIVDSTNSASPQYLAVLVYDGQSSEPLRTFAFDGGANAEVAPRTTRIDVRSDGIVLTQANIVDDGSGGLAQGDPLFTVYNIPAASVAAAIPAPGSTETNIDTTAAGVVETTMTLADFGVGPLVGEFFDLNFLPETSGSPVFIAVREPIVDGGPTSDNAIIGTIDLSNGEVSTREISTAEVAPFGSYERDAVLNLIQTDAEGNYTSLTLSAPDQGDGLTRFQRFDFATERFSGVTQGGDDTQELIVASDFREIIDGGDQNTGNDNDAIVVGNQTDTSGVFTVSVVNGVATVSVSTAALLTELAGVTDDGSPIPIEMDVFIAGDQASFDINSVAGGANTTSGGATALSVFSAGIETSRVTVDIDLNGINLLEPQPETIDLFSATVSGMDGTIFYGLGVSLPFEGNAIFDGFNVVGGVEDGSRKTVILEDSQGRGGADVISGFDVNNVNAADEDLLIIEADFNTYRGGGIETVAEGGTLTIGQSTGIVIFEGATENEDAAVITRATDANLGLTDGETIIAVTADADNTSLWTLTYDASGPEPTYQTDSFGLLSGVTADDLASFTNDDFTNIMLDIQPLPTV